MYRIRTAAALAALSLGLAGPAHAGTQLSSPVLSTPNDHAPVVTGGQCYPGADQNLCRRVLVLKQIGNWIYAGGIIDAVVDRSTGVAVSIGGFHNIFRYDATTFAVDRTFAPQLFKSGESGTSTQYLDSAITGIAASGDSLYVAGSFTQVASSAGGPVTARHGVAALSQTSGAVLTYNAKSNAAVNDVEVVGGSVWLGGSFAKLGMVVQPAIAFTDPTTGALVGPQIPISGQFTSTTPLKVAQIAVNNDGTKAGVIGNFTTVGGTTHDEVFVADISGGSASVDSFNSPNFAASRPSVCNAKDTWARGVDWSPDNIHFDIAASGGGGFDAYGASGALCDALSRFNSGGGSSTIPDFVNVTGFDSLFTVTDTGPYLYTGGHNKSLNHALYVNGVKVSGVKQELHYGIGAIDTTTGAAVTSFNASTATGRGAGWASSLSTPAGVTFGGDAQVFGSDTSIQRLVFLPAS